MRGDAVRRTDVAGRGAGPSLVLPGCISPETAPPRMITGQEPPDAAT